MRSAPLLVLLLGFALPAAAGERVVLVEGRRARSWLDFEVRPSRTENSAPDVVRAEPGPGRGELVFWARNPGKATVIVRDGLGDETATFEVDVIGRRVTDEKHALDGLPDSVRVSVEGPYVVLRGTVSDPHEMWLIDELAGEAPNVLVEVKYVPLPRSATSLASSRIEHRLRAEWSTSESDDGRRAPDLEPVDSPAFERFAVTLLPGTFVVATHPFPAANTSFSTGDVAVATSEGKRTLFVATKPGTAVYVVRDAADARWVVFDVTVIDPAKEPVQRTVPQLPAGVRVSYENDAVVLEGAVSSPDDMGVVEAVSAMFPDAINRVSMKQPFEWR